MSDPIDKFFDGVSTCALCHGVGGIFVPKSNSTKIGPEMPRVLILGEQPDPESARRTGQNDLTQGTQQVQRLRDFLRTAAIDESDVFYATSVMCIPGESTRRGSRPSALEMRNCVRHVEKLLSVLSPQVIVPVGHTSIQSVQWVYHDWKELCQFILNYDIGNVLERNGVTVYPLYHTSTATLRARPQDRQDRDWRRLGSIVESLGSRVSRK